MTIISKFKSGIKGAREAIGPQKYTIQDHQIVCVQCNHDRFEGGTAQLNTVGLTFFNLDWANKNAHILACDKCGYIMWFAKKPNRVSNV